MNSGRRSGRVVLVLMTTFLASAVHFVPMPSRLTVVSPLMPINMDILQFKTLATEMADEYERQILEFGLFRLNDKELVRHGITQVLSEEGPDWVVAWSKSTPEDKKAIRDAIEKTNVSCYGSCGHGRAAWYVPREQFFAARKALSESTEVRSLCIRVVTPTFR
ncbi:MAG: hypothetical protein JWM11_1835 [Planctomycetaceae bacterium]|nr:hypothetical protein [Planctomycetaceae bacterium]